MKAKLSILQLMFSISVHKNLENQQNQIIIKKASQILNLLINFIFKEPCIIFSINVSILYCTRVSLNLIFHSVSVFILFNISFRNFIAAHQSVWLKSHRWISRFQTAVNVTQDIFKVWTKFHCMHWNILVKYASCAVTNISNCYFIWIYINNSQIRTVRRKCFRAGGFCLCFSTGVMDYSHVELKTLYSSHVLNDTKHK